MILKSLLKWSIPAIVISPIFCAISCDKNNNDNLKEIKAKFEDYLNTHQNIFTKNQSANTNEIKNFQLYKDWTNLDDLLSNNYLSKYFTINDEFKNFLKENNNEVFKKIKAFVIQPIVGSANLKIIFYLDKMTNDLGVVDSTISNFFDSSFAYQNQINLLDNLSSNNYYENIDEFNKVWNELKDPKNATETTLNTMLIKGFGFKEGDERLSKININNYKSGYFKLIKSGYQIILSLEQKALNEGYIFVQNFNNNLPTYNVEWTSSQLVKEN